MTCTTSKYSRRVSPTTTRKATIFRPMRLEPKTKRACRDHRLFQLDRRGSGLIIQASVSVKNSTAREKMLRHKTYVNERIRPSKLKCKQSCTDIVSLLSLQIACVESFLGHASSHPSVSIVSSNLAQRGCPIPKLRLTGNASFMSLE